MDKFSARETEWLLELDGIPLASFWPRAIAFSIDSTIVFIITSIIATLGTMAYMDITQHTLHPAPLISTETIKNLSSGDEKKIEAEQPGLEKLKDNEPLKILQDIIMPVLYYGLLLWRGKGQTPGKRLMKIRVVSLMHRHLSLWHSVERALGYGAAFLEGGFGFIQYFIHPYRRCVQDRIAETIVVTEAGYQAMQHKLSHPLIPDK